MVALRISVVPGAAVTHAAGDSLGGRQVRLCPISSGQEAAAALPIFAEPAEGEGRRELEQKMEVAVEALSFPHLCRSQGPAVAAAAEQER